jgi:hypothetical protein
MAMMMVLALCAMTVTAFATGEEVAETSAFYQTIWSLLPPVVAIALALITKEVYSSLFIGILAGGLMYSGFSFEGTINHVFVDGMIAQLSDGWNVGILVFLVILVAMVMLMNRAGGSAAFGRWSVAHVKTKLGAQIATIVLGGQIERDPRVFGFRRRRLRIGRLTRSVGRVGAIRLLRRFVSARDKHHRHHQKCKCQTK